MQLDGQSSACMSKQELELNTEQNNNTARQSIATIAILCGFRIFK